MKLNVESWNNGTSSYNAEAEETAFLSYKIEHQFNEPATATIILKDPTGSIAQKYNVDANDVYICAGRCTIEDPNGSDVFLGRIVRADADTEAHTVTLTARDWLDQLDDEIVDYDMREDLDGAGLRESQLRTDLDSTIHIGPVARHIYGAVSDNGGVETDETTAANSDTTNDMTLVPNPLTVNDAYYFGFAGVTRDSFWLYISTVGNWIGTLAWEYSKGADVWATLTTGSWVAGQSTFECAAGWYEYDFTIPGDWATDSVGALTYYWVRARVAVATGQTTLPKGAYAATDLLAFDDDMSWDADEHNGKYLVLPESHVGEQTVVVGPYSDTVAPAVDTEDGSYADMWTDDGVQHTTQDNDASWTVVYKFRPLIPRSARLSSLTKARFRYSYNATVADDETSWINFYDNNSAIYRQLTIIPTFVDTGEDPGWKKGTWEIPEQYVTAAILTDANGESTVKFYINWVGGIITLGIEQLVLEIDCITTGYTSLITITDTTTNSLIVDTDLSITGAGLWEGCPYCICKKIYSHIDGIVTAGDTTANPLTTSVESTSGISTDHFEKKSRLQILQALTERDNAVFWLPLASSQVQWKQTTDSSSTALADSGVLSWQTSYDTAQMFNKYTVYGIRIGDALVSGTDSDATSIAKFNATRSKILSSRALSTRDATAVASALVDRDKDIDFSLSAELAGLSSIRLGDYLAVTSTILNLSAAAYTVTAWNYDSKRYRTTITLEPRGTTGYSPEPHSMSSAIQQVRQQESRRTGDTYTPGLTTQEWT